MRQFLIPRIFMKQNDRSPKKWAAHAAALLTTLLLCSCDSLLPTDVSPTTADLDYGDWPLTVKVKMGPPQRTEDWVDEGGHHVIGEIWHYNDEWHTKTGWCGWKDNFLSRDLYFDSSHHLAGWKLVEPLSSQGRAREHFWTDEMWKDKAEKVLRDFLHNREVEKCQRDVSTANWATVEQECDTVDSELRKYPLTVRYGHEVRDLIFYCRRVSHFQHAHYYVSKETFQGTIDDVLTRAQTIKREL